MTHNPDSGKSAPRYTCIAPRHPAPEGYTAISHNLINDNSLTMTALGLLFEMMSYPQERTFTAIEMIRPDKETHAEITEALLDLEAHGLVKRVQR